MAEQTIPLPASAWTISSIKVQYNFSSNRPQIDAGLTPADTTRYLRQIIFRNTGAASASFDDQASGGGGSDQDDLSSLFETNGSITLTVGNHSVTIGTEADDTSDPYIFTPSNAAEVIAFVQAVQPGGAMDGTLVLRDFVPAPASFSDDTGTDFDGTVGTGISDVTVPRASGNPTPTYAVVGSLPGGISFSTSTRRISGTPTGAGSGTITIRATNSEGTDDWTVGYSFFLIAAPSFSDNTGTDFEGTVGTGISGVTVPLASGYPAPTYAVQGSLPAGLSFNASSRVISGTPTGAGSGTITIRATNREGSDDWTVGYAFMLLLSLADILVPDGRALVGTGSLMTVGASGNIFDPPDSTVIAGSDPPGLGDSSLNTTRIYVTGNPQLRISSDGLGNIESFFEAGGAQEDYQVHIQTSKTAVVTYSRSDIDAAKSTGLRLLLGASGDPQGLLVPVAALESPDRVLFFLTQIAATKPVGVTFTGSTASLSLALTKILPAGKQIAATFTGPAGSVSLALTKRTVARKALAATFTVESGSVSLALTKRAVARKALAVTFTGSTASLSLALTKRTLARNALVATFTAETASLTLALSKRPAVLLRTVTLVLGSPTASSPAWIQWDDRTDGLGDLSTFAEPAGQTRLLVRLRIFDNGGIQFQVIDVLTGQSGFGTSEELTARWEQSLVAITVQAARVSDLVIPGPDSTGANSRDTTEPYAWSRKDVSTQDNWLSAYRLDPMQAVTIVVSDKGPTSAAPLDAKPIAATFTAEEGSVSLALTKRTLARKALAATFTAESGSVSLALSVLLPSGKSIGVTFTGPTASLSLALTLRSAARKALAATFTAESGSLSFALSKRTVVRKALAATFTAESGSVSFALMKLLPAGKSIEVTFTGNQGELSIALRKLGISTKPVGATFSNSAGALTLALTKRSLLTKPLAVTFTGETGSLTLALTTPVTKPIGVTFTGAAGGGFTVALSKQFSSTLPLTDDSQPSSPVIDLDSRVDLLIPQYEEATSLRVFLRGAISLLKVEVVKPLEAMSRGMNPEIATGVLLDWLGTRLAFPRPFVATADAVFFGFSGTKTHGGRTFGQAPFHSVKRGLELIEPVGDETFSRFLLARARRLRGGADRETIEAVLTILFGAGNGYVDETVTPITLRVTSAPNVIWRLASTSLFEALIPRPAGRVLKIVRS